MGLPPAAPPIRLLFVCMGNICRSPLAEGVFLHRARVAGVLDRFEVDSAGTGDWHAGERADPRSLAVARKHGIELPSIARRVNSADFDRFDRMLVMDRQNERDLLAMGAPPAKIEPILRYHPDPPLGEVPDPYSGGPEGFDQMYALIDASCRGLLSALMRTDGSECT